MPTDAEELVRLAVRIIRATERSTRVQTRVYDEGNLVSRGNGPIAAPLLDEPHRDAIKLADCFAGKYVIRFSTLHDSAILENEGLRKDRQNLLHVMCHVNEARMTGVLSD